MVESVDAEAFQQRLWGFETVPDIVRVMDLQQEWTCAIRDSRIA